MSPEEYLIHELAKQAGVSVRTIRYYIEAGLLPAPDSKGRYATYSGEYLDRLELIRRLKAAFLPLKEIRDRVSGLSAAEVRDLLARMDAELPSESPQALRKVEEKPSSSALDYIARVLESQNPPLPPSRPLPSAAQPRTLPAPDMSLPVTPPPSPSSEETWQRVRLAPGVEIHIAQPVEPRLRSRVERLLALAKSLFEKQS